MSLESFKASSLVGLDFDGTIADTFTQPKNGFGVEAAYHVAIARVFKPSALESYKASGGLRNRAPIEVVRQLARYRPDDSEQTLLDELDAVKLEVISSQISPSWPQPAKGFVDFSKNLEKSPHDQAIISSGHESFIEKVYEKTLGVEPPKIILAQETIARIARQGNIETPVKPSPQLLVYAYARWRGLHGLEAVDQIAEDDKPRIHYVGDDPQKDGKMAAAAGVNFHQLYFREAENTWRQVERALGRERQLT
ncbi:MAG TPA: hypothetical protein VGE34_02205 [Candidatus Saccharimonadales bacterium]